MCTAKWKVRVRTDKLEEYHWFLTRQEASDFVLPFVHDSDCTLIQVTKVIFLFQDCSDDANHTQRIS